MARARSIAEQIGDKHVQLELASDRGVVQLEAGLVDDGLTDLLAVIHTAGESGADLVDLVASNHLIDGFLWLLRLARALPQDGVPSSGRWRTVTASPSASPSLWSTRWTV